MNRSEEEQQRLLSAVSRREQVQLLTGMDSGSEEDDDICDSNKGWEKLQLDLDDSCSSDGWVDLVDDKRNGEEFIMYRLYVQYTRHVHFLV